MAVAVDEERAELLGADDVREVGIGEGWCQRTFGDPMLLVIDLIASVPFYWFMFFAIVPDKIFYPCLWVFIGLMVLWRFYRGYAMPAHEEATDPTPYTCGIVKSNGKVMFMV